MSALVNLVGCMRTITSITSITSINLNSFQWLRRLCLACWAVDDAVLGQETRYYLGGFLLPYLKIFLPVSRHRLQFQPLILSFKNIERRKGEYIAALNVEGPNVLDVPQSSDERQVLVRRLFTAFYDCSATIGPLSNANFRNAAEKD